MKVKVNGREEGELIKIEIHPFDQFPEKTKEFPKKKKDVQFELTVRTKNGREKSIFCLPSDKIILMEDPGEANRET